MRRLIFSGTRREPSEDERRALLRRIDWYTLNLVGGDQRRVGVGDCPTGFDALVRERLPKAKIFEADWEKLGRAAGPKRNGNLVQWAAMEPTSYLVAAPHVEGHRGTLDTIKRAIAAGLRVNSYPLGAGWPT